MDISNSSPDLSPSKRGLAPNKSLVNRFQAKRTRKNYNAVQANSTFGQDLACMEASQNDDRFAALSKKVSGASTQQWKVLEVAKRCRAVFV